MCKKIQNINLKSRKKEKKNEYRKNTKIQNKITLKKKKKNRKTKNKENNDPNLKKKSKEMKLKKKNSLTKNPLIFTVLYVLISVSGSA